MAIILVRDVETGSFYVSTGFRHKMSESAGTRDIYALRQRATCDRQPRIPGRFSNHEGVGFVFCHPG